jgi:hypothetical protein
MRFTSSKAIVCLWAAATAIYSQDVGFDAWGRQVQVHGFVSQGLAWSGQNNYLTMHTSGGSFAFTDSGVNMSSNVTDKFRVGAQAYMRDIGRLGQWHPQLDWAQGDYRFGRWLGIRAGKVKTVVGLKNDTQDMEFLHTFAILPQSIYPLDTRAATIAHLGADVYGDIEMKKLGTVTYTAFVGRRNDDLRGGWPYVIDEQWNNQIKLNRYSGRQFGADLRWNTPVSGLLVGTSHINGALRGTGILFELNDAGDLTGNSSPYFEKSNKDFTNQFYGEYTRGDFRVASEYRRAYRDERIFNGEYPVVSDTRGWYVSGSYRINKRIELGAYHSRLVSDWATDHDSPNNHVFDTTATVRLDLTKRWTVKFEGHRMDGHGGTTPAGFYGTDNPAGFRPTTNLLVIRTGVNF